MFNFLRNLFHHEQTSKKEKLISALVFFFYIFFMGYAGGDISGNIGSFYGSLTKPSLTPPNWVFPIVWTILFVLIGLAGYYVWNFYENSLYRKIFAALYAINGILVYLWPYIFFQKQLITTALYVIIGLIIVIELMIITAFNVNRKAAYILMPYLLWVLFAMYLNTSIIVLN